MAEKGTYRTRIRYGGTCYVCGQAVPKGVDGWYDSVRRKVACATHEFATESVAASVASEQAQSSSAGESDGLPRLIKAKYASTCTVCGAEVAKGADLFWVPGTKVVVCPPCTAGEVAAGLDG